MAECRFEGEPKRLELRLEHVPGEHFECPQCKALCGVHDTLERRWRHLNFFQYRCELVAKVPRTWCRKDGVHQVQVPWARAGSGFTLLMEALVMCLSAQMPVDGIADLLQESDTRLWRVLIHYVEQTQARRDWKTVRRIAVDETSARRGHPLRDQRVGLRWCGPAVDGRRTQFYFRTAAYLRAGRLKFELPVIN